MDVLIGNASGWLARQPVDVPELSRICVRVQQIVDTQGEFPAAFESVAAVEIDLPIAFAPYLIVGCLRETAQIPIFQTGQDQGPRLGR